MKPRPASNPQNLDELMFMAEDFAGFSLRSGRKIYLNMENQNPPSV